MEGTTSTGRLVVPVANPETVGRLMDTAIDIAVDHNLEMVVVHVVEVPPQIPLSEGSCLVDEGGEIPQMLDYATEQATDAGVPVESRIRYARDVATGIVGAIDSYDGSDLLVGWRGRPRRRDIVLGSFIDRLLGEAPCDVYVKRIRTPPRAIDSILVPISGGPHSELAVELAGTIAAQRDATVTLMTVLQPDPTESVLDDVHNRFDDATDALPEETTVDTKLVYSDHVAGSITDETANHDLTILGATQESLLRRKLVGSVAQGVGRSAASSVILVRRAPDDV